MATPSQSYFTTLTRLVHDALDTINLERLDNQSGSCALRSSWNVRTPSHSAQRNPYVDRAIIFLKCCSKFLGIRRKAII